MSHNSKTLEQTAMCFFPWFPIKKKMKRLVQNRKVTLLLAVLTSETCFWQWSPLASDQSEKESSLGGAGWGSIQPVSLSCPDRQILRLPGQPSLLHLHCPVGCVSRLSGREKWTGQQMAHDRTRFTNGSLSLVLHRSSLELRRSFTAEKGCSSWPSYLFIVECV